MSPFHLHREKGRNDAGIRRSRLIFPVIGDRNILWRTQTPEHASALRISRDNHTYSIPKYDTFGGKRTSKKHGNNQITVKINIRSKTSVEANSV